MPKLKPGTLLPTPEEDAAIAIAASTDPDARVLTDEEWEEIKPRLRVGRPRLESPKQPMTIRIDADVLAALKASGKGWQTRVNDALRAWLVSQGAL